MGNEKREGESSETVHWPGLRGCFILPVQKAGQDIEERGGDSDEGVGSGNEVKTSINRKVVSSAAKCRPRQEVAAKFPKLEEKIGTGGHCRGKKKVEMAREAR